MPRVKSRIAATIKIKPVDTETMQERIYLQLKHLITAGELKPGQILSYRSLAEALGTSPMPVRDAVRRLVSEHALETLPNRTIGLPILTPAQIRELYYIRPSLEGLATEEAAKHIKPKAIKRLQEIQQELPKAGRANNIKAYLALNQEFHFTIYRASGMPVLIDMIERLWLQNGPLIHHTLQVFDLDSVVKFHGAALTALAKGDGKAARAAIEKDITDAGRLFMEALAKNPTNNQRADKKSDTTKK